MLSHEYNIVIDRSVGAPGNGKYVVDGFNATEKMFILMLMKAVKVPVVSNNDSQMVIHNSRSNTDISLATEFQKNISDPKCAHSLIDHRKDRKRASKLKCTERAYYVLDRKYVYHKSLKFSCA